MRVCVFWLQEQLRLFANREKPPAKARKAGVPKQDAVPDFLNGRQLRDYQACLELLRLLITLLIMPAGRTWKLHTIFLCKDVAHVDKIQKYCFTQLFMQTEVNLASTHASSSAMRLPCPYCAPAFATLGMVITKCLHNVANILSTLKHAWGCGRW